MKLTILLLGFLGVPMFNWAQVNGNHKYVGRIGDNLYITLELAVKIKTGYVTYSGYYYYNAIGKPITLRGGYNAYAMNGSNPNAEDCIFEYVQEQNTGVLCFKRNAIGQHYLLGTWEDSKGKLRYKISLERIEL
jgi:hypothetical protein